jgi:hypothetical protein
MASWREDEDDEVDADLDADLEIGQCFACD